MTAKSGRLVVIAEGTAQVTVRLLVGEDHNNKENRPRY